MKIYIKEWDYNKIINHCVRKLNSIYEDDETKERQAFGVIVGRKIDKNQFFVTRIVNLKNNYRFEDLTSKKMNSYIEKYAIPGGADVNERAWAIDPIELNYILVSLNGNEEFLGTYHMHSDISWAGDYPKYLPTLLDRKLNINSGLINLIVYIGEKKQQIRAFFESNIDMEYELIVVDGDDYSEN
ncbi:MAG: hypothetical protein IK997_07735 [Bacilli bacterium]|nr:hypothetical protein [Bacilli bacterium]